MAIDTTLYHRKRIWALLAGSIVLILITLPRLSLGVRLFTRGISMQGEIIRVDPLSYVVRAGGTEFVIPKNSVVQLIERREAGEELAFVVIPNDPLSARRTAFPVAHFAVFAIGVAMLLVMSAGWLLARRPVSRAGGSTSGSS